MNNKQHIVILTTNHTSRLDRGQKDKNVLLEMNAARDGPPTAISSKVATDMNVVLIDKELTVEIATLNSSLREVMKRSKRLLGSGKIGLQAKFELISHLQTKTYRYADFRTK